MSSLNKRPKPGETLQDIIALEKEYLQGNGKPAAKACRVNVSKPGIGDDKKMESIKNENRNSAERQTTHLRDTSCFTGSVIEKNVFQPCIAVSSKSTAATILSTNKERVSKFKLERDRMKQNEIKLQNPSSEVMRKIKKNYDAFDPFKKRDNNTPILLGQSNQEFKVSSCEYDRSRDISIGEKVHPLLAGYTEADILKARESLLASMKPETKEILVKRRAISAKTENDPKTLDTQSANTVPMEMLRQVSVEDEDFQILLDEVKNVPHMDTLESEKLEWTKSVKVKSSQNKSAIDGSGQEVRMARFALDGSLITNDIDTKSWDQALHHHGDEMERPGYTMEELFVLSRSTFSQQRTISLNILAEIFKRSHNGEFDFALDPSIFHTCNELDFIHVLRISADYRESATLNASINCLASLLFHEQEELCLDIVFNWPNSEPYPWLDITPESSVSLTKATTGHTSSHEEITDSDLKDFQYIKNDLIKFLVNRTNIITRFSYIFTNMIQFLNEVGVQGMLKICVRIARHSPNKIMEYKDLLKCIQENFMTPNWSENGNRPSNMTGIPLALALKLFRVLVTSNSQNAKILYEEFYPFPSMMSYLAYNQWRDQNLIMNVEFLILESFNLWEAFLSYGYGIQEYTSFFPVMINFFQAFYRLDTLGSFDLTFAARLHSLLEKILTTLNASENRHSQYNGIKEAIGYTSSFVVKMLTLLGRENTAELLDHDLCLLAILKGLECLSLAREYETFANVVIALKKFIGGLAYSKLTKCFMTHSLLLFHLEVPSSDIEKEKAKYPNNMTTSGTILFGGFQVPILNKGSPFVFMTSLLRYLDNIGVEKEILSESLLDANCKSYLTALCSKDKLPTRNNDFLRFELYCVYELLKLLPLQERVVPIYKILPHVQGGDEPLVKELLENFIQSSSIPESEEMSTFCNRFLLIPNLEKNLYNFKKLSRKVIPCNWIVEPLNILYSSSLHMNEIVKMNVTPDVVENIQKKEMERALVFLNFLLKNFDKLVISNIMDIPTIYTRIVLVFMLGDRIFLEKGIQQDLKTLLKLLLSNKYSKSKRQRLFSNYNKVEGFPVTFSSLYSELLVEFAANSFGDEVFGAYLILPLRTCEDAHLKSLFWNDQSVQFIRTSVEQSSVPLEYFTAVPETDRETLTMYDNAIRSKRITAERNPLLHAICSFHLTHSTQCQMEVSLHAAESELTEA